MSTTESEGEEIKKSKITISKSYPNILKSKNKAFWDYENFSIKWNDSSNYVLFIFRLFSGCYQKNWKRKIQ
jgi:hypothetical protein